MDDYGRRLMLLVAQEIGSLRESQGLSLDSLAARSGMHPTSIGLVVRGRRGLTLASAASLSRALGVPLSELIRMAEADLGK